MRDVEPSSQAEELSYFIGENIDCWAVQLRREFASFMANLPGLQDVRGFLKHLKGGGIIAATAGLIQMILAIVGTRAALASFECARYPYTALMLFTARKTPSPWTANRLQTEPCAVGKGEGCGWLRR